MTNIELMAADELLSAYEKVLAASKDYGIVLEQVLGDLEVSLAKQRKFVIELGNLQRDTMDEIKHASEDGKAYIGTLVQSAMTALSRLASQSRTSLKTADEIALELNEASEARRT